MSLHLGFLNVPKQLLLQARPSSALSNMSTHLVLAMLQANHHWVCIHIGQGVVLLCLQQLLNSTTLLWTLLN